MCTVLALPPRFVPRSLWRFTVSDFYFEDELGIRRLPWSEPTEVEIRPESERAVLHYTAPNEIWMRTATVPAAELRGSRLTYRARLLPFLKPHVTVERA